MVSLLNRLYPCACSTETHSAVSGCTALLCDCRMSSESCFIAADMLNPAEGCEGGRIASLPRFGHVL